MNILISINHPAHVHFFKNFIYKLNEKKHKIVIVARDKEMTLNLLDAYNLKNILLTKKKKTFWGSVLELVSYQFKLFNILKKYNIEVSMSIGGTFVAHVSKFIGIPSLCFYDTENANLQNFFTYPFCTKVITPECYEKKISKNQVHYNSYHEMAYLHPKYFNPDISIFNFLGLKKNEKYVIMRFVGWDASHDKGHVGLSIDSKITAVKAFSKYAKIFISSEKDLPHELEDFKILIPPELIHHAITFASLVYGESATMTSEAAVLGTPAIYIDNEGRGYTNEQEKIYGIVHNFRESNDEQEKSILKGLEILKMNQRNNVHKREKNIINDKIDLTGWMINYVESKKYLK